MRFPILIACCLAACMLICHASAETRIAIPEGSFEGTADLPVIISGITAATGVSFELSYDRSIVRIESIVASSEIPGSAVTANIDNDAGHAKVAIPNTQGISAMESASLAVIRFTRAGPGGSTVAIQDPRWSDAQFTTHIFDVVLNGKIISPEAVTPAEAATSPSGSEDSSLSSSASMATPTSGSTATPVVTAPGSTSPPVVTTDLPGATTLQSASSGGSIQLPPAASAGTTTENTQPPATPKAAPGFCTGTVLVAGLSGVALLLYRRS